MAVYKFLTKTGLVGATVTGLIKIKHPSEIRVCFLKMADRNFVLSLYWKRPF